MTSNCVEFLFKLNQRIMRKNFKLFPVALAVVALASCSSDDLTGGGSNEIKLQSNQLLVVAEELGIGDITRAGFVEDEVSGKLSFVTVFNKGDKMKIYDDTQNWRPQDWECVSTTDVQYTQEAGAAGGTSAVFQVPSGGSQYKSGYGIYPSTYKVGTADKKFGQFTDEERKSMKFDFDMFKVYTAQIVAANLPETSEYKDGLFCKFPVPMWGVADNTQKMSLKYLTGFLRIDIAKVPAIAANNSRWLLIRSNKALTGEFTATIADPDADLTTAAPVLAGPTANVSTDALATYPKTGSATGNTDILVNIGNASGNITVYVPIAAGKDAATAIAHTFAIYLSGATSDAAGVNSIDFTGAGAKQIAHKGSITITKNAQRGQVYNVIDDSYNTNASAHTPYDMTKAIVDADKAAKRDFTITFTNPILVKNDDESTQNYYLDLTFTKYGETDYNTPYVLKHNVTVNVNLQKDASASAARRLFVKTPAGGKELTLNFTGMTGIDQINVLDGELKSKLVLKRSTDAQLPNVNIGPNNVDLVTVKAGANAIYANSNFTIDAGSNAGDNIDALTIAKGLTKLTVKNGRISNIYFGGTEKIAADVEIYTTGKVGVNAIDFTNMPKNNAGTATEADKYNVIFNSVWDGSKTTVFPVTTVNGKANTIIAASQLAAAGAGTDYNVVGTYDLSGSSKTWSAVTLTKSVKGAQYVREDKRAVALTGKATIKNLGGAQGLIATWTPAAANDEISNIVFDGTNKVKGASGANAIGLLVGLVDNSNASGVIKNIEVKGTNVIEGQGNGAGIGGLIGKVDKVANALILAGNKVGGNTTIKGFKNLGGIVGEAAGKVTFAAMKADGTLLAALGAAYDATTDVYNEAGVKFDHYQIGGGEYSPNLATEGQFIGGGVCATAGDITIIGALNKVTDRAKYKWGYYLADKDSEYFPWRIQLYYNEIGHLGFKTGTDASGNIVQVDGTKFNGIHNIVHTTGTTYDTTVTLNGIVSKTTPTGETATMKYFDWVQKPY